MRFDLSNLKIVQDVGLAINHLIFIKDEQGQAIKIVGELNHVEFNERAVDYVLLSELGFWVMKYLERSKAIISSGDDKEIVEALYFVKKAEALINVDLA